MKSKSCMRSEAASAGSGTEVREIRAPKGFHWMEYVGGPVLMAGDDSDRPGASKTLAFEVVKEHDESRLPGAMPMASMPSGPSGY